MWWGLDRVVQGWVLALVVAGCGGDVNGRGDASLPRDDAGHELDGGVAPGDGGLVDGGAPAPGLAPEGALPGAVAGSDGDQPIAIAPDAPAIVRVDALPTEHITFFVSFDPGAAAAIELEVLRWDGTSAAHLGTTDAGPGLRTLAAFDPGGPRTFFARVTADAPVEATLTITRVPFADGRTCTEDCAHLLQLPLPNDPAIDGYATSSGTVFRYQYGRRDLLMMLRHAGQRMIELGMSPFLPQDLSQWDGMTPGTDVGAPRHASHQRGKDVDISLYGVDGQSIWRSFCTTENLGSGRECVAGTEHDYDALANATFFGDFFGSGRVTMCFLDQELIDPTIPAADEAAALDRIDASVVSLYSDGTHLQHWPNHDNHIHVRVSEEPTTGFVWSPEPLPIEPP